MKYIIYLCLCSLFSSFAKSEDYNIVQNDGSFEFGYKNPDSYHFAQGSRQNVVRGEFGSRNPGTGKTDKTIYTAGPRGFRPRGNQIVRKYDLNQSKPPAIGSPDDIYYDPYEDPSYSYAFKTRTYSKQENANSLGDVSGRYSYFDDIGERHDVEYIAGKNTGFHVKTPFPDNNSKIYGPLYLVGKDRRRLRGRTSIQRQLDGSYRFASAGPDQRRTESRDSTGHVKGSYTYLDDKGVQHSVHYIAGPETGYRVLKNVKGPHVHFAYPFSAPEIIPTDNNFSSEERDVFETAASGSKLHESDIPKAVADSDGGDTSSPNNHDEVGDKNAYESSAQDTADDFTDTKLNVELSESPAGSDENAYKNISENESNIFNFEDLFDDQSATTTNRPK